MFGPVVTRLLVVGDLTPSLPRSLGVLGLEATEGDLVLDTGWGLRVNGGSMAWLWRPWRSRGAEGGAGKENARLSRGRRVLGDFAA